VTQLIPLTQSNPAPVTTRSVCRASGFVLTAQRLQSQVEGLSANRKSDFVPINPTKRLGPPNSQQHPYVAPSAFQPGKAPLCGRIS
jgi:hypothetical protein